MNTITNIALGLLIAASPSWAAINVNLSFPTLDIFYIGDLDPFDAGGQIDNFELSFEVENAGDYRVDLQFEYLGAAGNVEIIASNLLLSGVQRAQYNYNLSDFRNGTASFGGTLDDSNTDFNDDAMDDLNFTGNSLPAGTYRMTVTSELLVTPPSPANLPEISTTELVISEPLSTSLQLPWDGAIIENDFPVFLWSGRAREYVIRVSEFDPLRHGSFEEAIEDESMWRATVGDLRGMSQAPTTAAYGEGGFSRPLVAGRTYVWNVEAVLSTTSGEEFRSSPIWTFIYDPDSDGAISADEASYQEIMSFLNGFLGGQADEILSLLQGMELAGPIMINGEPVDAAQLAQIFQDIASGELNIASMSFE